MSEDRYVVNVTSFVIHAEDDDTEDDVSNLASIMLADVPCNVESIERMED